jgi:hypothetical protein
VGAVVGAVGDLAAVVGAAAEAQDLAKMKSSGKLIGSILSGGGLLLLLAIGIWILLAEGNTTGGRVLGLVLALLILSPIIAVGIYMLIRGGQEDKAMAHVAQQRKLLNIIKTKGQVSISDLTLELDSTFDQVQAWIYDLVGKGLFSGYINWEEGTLYSQQASHLQDETRCKHCGGELSLAGKGVVRCPYCGTEYFIA